MKISVVVNTRNEEKNIARCLKSVKNFADEIIVVDMHSEDRTVEISKTFGAKVFQHEYTRYVEPARNFALSKAVGDWVLLIDADEELPSSLAGILGNITGKENVDFVEIPRKNIIFGKWIEHSRWWPDYLIRFFRKGKVNFSDKIHVPPVASGAGIKLEEKEEKAIIHHHLQSVSQFMERINRYSDIQSEELLKSGYKFKAEDLIFKPANEFFSRFFAGEGYKDGLHGLALSVLQGFSEFLVYLKIWETEGFKEQNLKDLNKWFIKISSDFTYWRKRTAPTFLRRIFLRIKPKL